MALRACVHTTALQCSMLVHRASAHSAACLLMLLCCPGMPLRKPHFTSGRPSLTLCYAPPLHLAVLQVYAPSRTVVVYAPAEYCDSQASPASSSPCLLCLGWVPCTPWGGLSCLVCLCVLCLLVVLACLPAPTSPGPHDLGPLGLADLLVLPGNRRARPHPLTLACLFRPATVSAG